MSGSTPPSPTASSTRPHVGFCYVWTTKVTTRKMNDDDATILLVSPKFATVHEQVSFQWNLRVHATTGRMMSEDDTEDGEVLPMDYVAVELYFVDGPVSQVLLQAEVGVTDKDSDMPMFFRRTPFIQEGKTLKMQRGVGCEITDADKPMVSVRLKDSIGKVVKVHLLIKMDSKLFDPFTYLDTVSPTPRHSFLTTNYNARVNSKVWKRRSRKSRTSRTEKGAMSSKEKTDYEKKFQTVLDNERHNVVARRCEENRELRVNSSDSRRSSLMEQIRDEKHHHDHEHDHIFKKILVACCESCEQRRASAVYDSRTEEESESDGEDIESDGDEPHFECRQSDKEQIHDMLANLYFNKVALPEMEYVEDFVDFLIDAELNDLPVLKRACERYLCSELNTKKDLITSLLLDLLFIAIVFNLPVMKSMTLSELANRTHEFVNPEGLMLQDEYKQLDRRMKDLADRSITELIEQCIAFRDQKARVRSIPLENESSLEPAS
ncbi:unnamed protein product [Caenorhabditis auriculariae]|uniref:Uncharacterized protein n=1 Tax=Caenorhabditis auriculariae TaxID=2777116 RepID=A0A8S1GRE5_9PELO|nr:unnamed protein product [Caenorhabditis auriculariae]